MRFASAQAGIVARRLQRYVPHERKHASNSPESEALTVIDLTSQDLLLNELHRAFPELAVDAEEDTETLRLFPPSEPGRPLAVLDPIDGTWNYTRGSNDYAVMGSLIANDRFEASLLHFPNQGLTCWAIAGEGCFVERAGQKPERIEELVAAPDVLVSPNVPSSLRTALAPLGRVVVSRCSAVDATAPVLGRAHLAVSSDRADRRRAIGFLLTTEAGGSVYFGDRRWAHEDPETLPREAAPSITAATEALARAALEACRT